MAVKKKDRQEYMKRYAREHSAERAAASKAWRKENPEKEKKLNAEQYKKRKREGKE